MQIPEFDEIIEPNDQTEARREHLEKLREIVGNVYPNKYERTHITGAEDTISNILTFAPIAELAKELKDATPEGEKPEQDLKSHLNEKLKQFGNVRISGRLAVPPRVMGKAAFVHLSDGKERLQIYVRKQDARVVCNDTGATVEGEDAAWEAFKLLDHGDFVGAEGYLFLTNTGELSVHVETFQFLSKSLQPMPDKMHGIADPELRRRYRYADLIASSLQVEHEGLTTREVFERRAKLISGMRRFLDDAGYIEVETPMLSPKATGAAATPFETYHKALDIPLYARIAPELYLKRLTVGGFEKVYELNRNFRNEGLSMKHNPEFTMLEFYCAYMDVNGMMDFAEEMIQESVMNSVGSLQVNYTVEIKDKDDNLILSEIRCINFSNFERFSMRDAIYMRLAEILPSTEIQLDISRLDNTDFLKRLIAFRWILLLTPIPVERQNEATIEYWLKTEIFESNKVKSLGDIELVLEKIQLKEDVRKALNIRLKSLFNGNLEDTEESKSRLFLLAFEELVESQLGIIRRDDGSIEVKPTFIIDYPKSISPLSKASPSNPNIAERFELFINGMECANGFSELNDPREQYERFVDQMSARESGDDEAMVLDEDYIRALSYGMPPAAGIGIGIDRLVMLLTNKHSIRDVILFPHMKPIVKSEQTEEE